MDCLHIGGELHTKRIQPRLFQWFYLRPSRRLFKSAGPLRDVQVQQQVVQKWGRESELELSEYYNALKQKEFAARKDFYRTSRKFDFKVFPSNWAKIRRSMMYISHDYVQFKASNLLELFRRDVEAAMREGKINHQESGDMVRFYEEGLSGYTYLNDDRGR